MKILPLLECNEISEPEVFEAEHSDRIYVSAKTFEYWISKNHAGTVIILKLINFSGITTMACVYGIHNDSNDIIYAPTWMYDLFIGDTETIEVCQYFPEMCRSLTLLPHVSLHIYKDDPQEYLRNGFEKYTCLMKGMTYNLLCGEDSEEFTTSIFTYEPESEDIVCIRNCEMELHLMKPLDMPDTPTPPPPDKPGELLPEMISSVMADLSAETPITPVTTVTAVTPVTAETAEMRRNAAAAAALKRMKSQITS